MIPGQGILQCQVNDHVLAGMSALYTVAPNATAAAKQVPSGRTRTYWVAADPISWDYAPQGRDMCHVSSSGKGTPFNADQEVFVATSNTTMGKLYRKAVFRGYTDSGFNVSAAQETASPSVAHFFKPAAAVLQQLQQGMSARRCCPFL